MLRFTQRNWFEIISPAHSELRIVTSKGVLALSPQAINITFQHVRDWLQQVIRVFTFVALPLSNTEQLEQVRRRALRYQAKLIRITSCKNHTTHKQNEQMSPDIRQIAYANDKGRLRSVSFQR